MQFFQRDRFGAIDPTFDPIENELMMKRTIQEWDEEVPLGIYLI